MSDSTKCGDFQSNDLVRQALAELGDVVRCRCATRYKNMGRHDPSCECDSADAVQMVADRIEELEANLAQAVEALDEAVYLLAPDEKDMMRQAGVYRVVTTLAELKGETDE